MKVLIYGINYSPELTGIGKYSGEMGSWLAGRGHQVKVITAPPYYPDWRVASGYSSVWFKTEYIDGVKVMRCPLYVPRKPSTLKRLIHLASFAITSGTRLFTQLLWRPDVVVCVVPTQFCLPAVIGFSWLCRAKRVVHVQDYELDAMFGLGMAGDSKLKNFGFSVESRLLKSFDRVSTISQSMMAKAVEKGVDTQRLWFFPNWSETKQFSGVDIADIDALRLKLGVPVDAKLVLYSGNMGEKQGLELVIEAAKALSDRASIFFVMVGRGAGRDRLEQLAGELNLENIVFSDLLPMDELPALLSMADSHLVVQKRGVADAVLPSKLTNILAVGGNAVITADQDTELGLLCGLYPGIAQLVEPESKEALVSGILATLEMPNPNMIASKYAEEHIDSQKVLLEFEKKLQILSQKMA